MAVSLLLCSHKKTISKAISFHGHAQFDWSAEYRLFNRSPWNPCDLFLPIIQKSLELNSDKDVSIVFDDTLIKKNGKKIKGTSWQRDPLSPRFHTNFVWGSKYLQASLVLPLYQDGSTPPRAIPIQFEQLPYIRKPTKNASKEEWVQFRQKKAKNNASTAFVAMLAHLRAIIDQLGYKKRIFVAVDGSYCNKTCLRSITANTSIIARIKKNARLCFKADASARGFYDKKKFSPEDVLKNRSMNYEKTTIFYASKYRPVKFKELKNVYWQTCTQRQQMRVVVIAPTPYQRHKNGKLCYRQPGFIITNDLDSPAALIIQKYFDRWQIEVNFQEEKGLLGIGHQQVWGERAIPRAPAFIAACYSMLLLSSVIVYKDRPDHPGLPSLPKWRRKGIHRLTCRRMLANIKFLLLKDNKIANVIGFQHEAKEKNAA